MEAFIREARIVTLSFYVDDLALKNHANLLIERRIVELMGQFKQSVSVHEVRNRAVDGYFDAGVKYFRRYALSNLALFMDDTSRNKFNYLVEELALIDEVIVEIRNEIKAGRNTFIALGEYLMIHIRLTAVKEAVENDMLAALESLSFKERLLPDIAKIFYEDNKKRTEKRTVRN